MVDEGNRKTDYILIAAFDTHHKLRRQSLNGVCSRFVKRLPTLSVIPYLLIRQGREGNMSTSRIDNQAPVREKTYTSVNAVRSAG